jgi:hypothetical protein
MPHGEIWISDFGFGIAGWWFGLRILDWTSKVIQSPQSKIQNPNPES